MKKKRRDELLWLALRQMAAVIVETGTDAPWAAWGLEKFGDLAVDVSGYVMPMPLESDLDELIREIEARNPRMKLAVGGNPVMGKAARKVLADRIEKLSSDKLDVLGAFFNQLEKEEKDERDAEITPVES